MTDEPKPVIVQERLDVCELDRARMALLNPALIEQKKEARTIDENAKPLLEITMKEGHETVWDRFEMQQPPCKYCESGTLLCPLYDGAVSYHSSPSHPRGLWCR